MIDIAKDEIIVAVVRRHWFTLLIQGVELAILFALPFILSAALKSSFLKNFLSEMTIALPAMPVVDPKIIYFFISLWLLMIWFRLFSVLTMYYLDKWVITSKRIISVDQVTFFSRKVSNFRIDRIQDITTKVDGLIETFIDFGDITIQTAGETGSFTMKNVPAPAKLKESITHQQEAISKGHRLDKAV